MTTPLPATGSPWDDEIEYRSPAGTLRARLSLWWSYTPELPGERVGAVGQYQATDDEAAQVVLDQGCRRLAEAGCTMAIGPMDGNTWHSYRLVTERGDEPPFFLEPWNPPEWPGQFLASGFTPVAHYSSALNADLGWRDPRVPRIRARLEDLGVRIRIVDVSQMDRELSAIYELSCISFRRNFLYAPIGREEFRQQYSSVLPHLQPELVWLAEDSCRCVGFVFALPDLLEVRRQASTRSAVLKTLAILPGRRYAGLGALLADACQTAAQELGYSRVIHALMHDANSSRNISSLYARSIRGYTLYGRRLRKTEDGREENSNSDEW